MAIEDPSSLSAEANRLGVSLQEQGILDARQTGRTPVPEPWTVEGALKAFNLPTPSSPPSSPIAFFHLIERLKTTPREGWRRFDIMHGESISDHMYRMSIITMLAPSSLSSRLDIPRCTRMALVHDMAESLVGDITPKDNVSKAEKSRREADTIAYIGKHLLGGVPSGGAEAGLRLQRDWQEYEDDETEEAHFVHDVDKLELVLQMVEYEKANAGRTLDLGEFSHVARRIRLPEMREWCAELMLEREKFWAAQGRHDVPGLDRGREIIADVEARRKGEGKYAADAAATNPTPNGV